MASRQELTAAEWARIAPVLPARETRRTYHTDHRRVLTGMLYRHATGCAWRDLPARFGPWSTVASRERRWTREGLWGRILAVLQGELAEAGRIDWKLWCIDGSHVRAHRVAAGAGGKPAPGEPADHALGRSRGGFTTKLHLVPDGHGLPLAVALSAGQAHESVHATRVLEAVRVPRRRPGRPRRRPSALAGDKCYSYPTIRHWLRRHGVQAVIPERADQVRQRATRPGRKPYFDLAVYRRRSAIECTVGALKEARAVATRYEKLAIHYLALVQISMIRLLVRRLEHPLSHRA